MNTPRPRRRCSFTPILPTHPGQSSNPTTRSAPPAQRIAALACPNTSRRQRQNHRNWPRPIDCRRQRPCNRNRPPNYQQGGPPRLKARAGGEPGLIEGVARRATGPAGSAEHFPCRPSFLRLYTPGIVPRVFWSAWLADEALAAERERRVNRFRDLKISSCARTPLATGPSGTKSKNR